MEGLFNCTTLTDVGGGTKLIKREALKKIENKFTVGGSHFGPELMLLIITHKIRFIEIPVNYKKRVGVSSVTGNKFKAFSLGLRIIGLILTHRLKTWLRKNDE
jgi:hypothetical protein